MAEDDTATPAPETPLDRLGRLLATDECEHCHRFTPPDPADLAEKFGVSQTTIRRLAHPTFVPTMPTIAKIAKPLGLAPLALAGRLWPDLTGDNPTLFEEAGHGAAE